MKLNLKHGVLTAFTLFCMSASSFAKVERTTVYMFGFSASFTDSVAYVTDMQQLDSAYIEAKQNFLIDRVVYSDQLQTYLEAMNLMQNCTCTVFFDTKKSKLEETYEKIRKRYIEDKGIVLKTLEPGAFKFQSPAYTPQSFAQETEQPKSGKKGKGRKASKEETFQK